MKNGERRYFQEEDHQMEKLALIAANEYHVAVVSPKHRKDGRRAKKTTFICHQCGSKIQGPHHESDFGGHYCNLECYRAFVAE
jgi:hypothetical protein